jgi:hypothetical protein
MRHRHGPLACALVSARSSLPPGSCGGRDPEEDRTGRPALPGRDGTESPNAESMGRRIRGVTGGLALAWLLLPRTAAAQTIESPYRFLDTRQSGSAFAGHVVTNTGAIELGPESGTIFGVRYDLGLGGPFTFEIELGWFSSTRAVQDTVPGDTVHVTVGDVDFRAIAGNIALRFNITGPRTWHGLLPYVLLGGGLTSDVAAESGTEKALPADLRFRFGNRFTGVMGGGVEWLPAPRMGVRFDVRNMLWKLNTPTAFLYGDRVLSLPGDQWTQNVSLTAGVSVRF